MGDAVETSYEKQLRAAERGQFEALVRAARPKRPLGMVTPQEREAELRAAGRWPSDERASTSPVTRGWPGGGEPPAPPATEPSPELRPNEQYLAELCRWGPSGPHDTYHHTRREILTDYSPTAHT